MVSHVRTGDEDMRRWIAISAAAAIAALAQGSAAQAQQQGDARRGKALAETWCASCHLVGEEAARSGTDRAPPFPAIARDPAKDAAYIRRWLTADHVQMPNFDLGRRETEDLIAYFRSLGG